MILMTPNTTMFLSLHNMTKDVRYFLYNEEHSIIVFNHEKRNIFMQPKCIPCEQAGLLWTWWKGDLLPELAPLPSLTITATENRHMLATLMGVADDEVATVLREGHYGYIAYMSNIPVAYGWSATNRANFGEGRVNFRVPAHQRYLYNFVTLPKWRGLGIYPRLLQSILVTEGRDNERFWIVHQLTNNASQRGIVRAGFQLASSVYYTENDSLMLVAEPENQRARAGAELFGLPLFIRRFPMMNFADQHRQCGS
jgi:GNAT superfamily N-acetyltransferase